MPLNSISNLINPVLLLTILFFYRRTDERFQEMLYGATLGLLALGTLGLMGRLDSESLSKLNDISIIGFLLAARATSLLSPLPGPAESEKSGSRADSGRRFVFNVLGVVLGLSPVFIPVVSLLTNAQPDGISGGTVHFLTLLFLLVWLGLTVRGHFFRLTLTLLGLAAVNLAYASGRLIAVIETFVHDYYHLYSVILLVPDHPYTRMWWYRAVDALLDPIFGATVLVLLLIGPLISTIKQELGDYRGRPRPHGPQERREKAVVRAGLRRQLFFAVTILLTVSGAAFADLPKDTIENPVAQPAMIEENSVSVAETNPFTRIEEDKIRKYFVEVSERKITFMVLKAGGV